MMKSVSVLLASLLLGTAARAQEPMPVIAVPPLTTPDDKPVGNGQTTLGVAWEASKLIAADLRTTAETMAIPPDQKDYYSYPEVTAPTFSRWRAKGAKALLTGFVRAQPDGRLAVGCYVDAQNFSPPSRAPSASAFTRPWYRNPPRSNTTSPIPASFAALARSLPTSAA